MQGFKKKNISLDGTENKNENAILIPNKKKTTENFILKISILVLYYLLRIDEFRFYKFRLDTFNNNNIVYTRL